MDSKQLKRKARERGADLVGIASAARWADWPSALNPRRIQPKCQSVIVVGRKVLRGALRGVEEGTSFYNTYGMYGKEWNETAFLVRVIHDVALALEASGAEAVPLLGGGAGLDAKALAREAGLGVIGKGGFFLTPDYGHRQRFGLILTDLALEGDAVAPLDLCKDCSACLEACPLAALRRDGDGAFTLDASLCASCRNGRQSAPATAYESNDRLASACGRACLVALEGRIGNRFEAPFRKRSTWSRDIEGRVSVAPLERKGS